MEHVGANPRPSFCRLRGIFKARNSLSIRIRSLNLQQGCGYAHYAFLDPPQELGEILKCKEFLVLFCSRSLIPHEAAGIALAVHFKILPQSRRDLEM